jgi:hypothetical protein
MLSPETGLIASVACKIAHRLDIGIGISGPHDFAVRVWRTRRLHHPRPPHPAPNVRDDRETPLVWARDGAAYAADFSEAESDLFLREGLDR